MAATREPETVPEAEKQKNQKKTKFENWLEIQNDESKYEEKNEKDNFPNPTVQSLLSDRETNGNSHIYTYVKHFQKRMYNVQ